MAQNLIIMSNVRIITKSTELPEMDCRDYFHSTDLFKILEQTPGCSPYMVVVTDEQDRIVAHLLAMINRRGSWIPPYLYSAGRVYGEGQYETEDASEIARLFELMLEAITKKFRRRLCLYFEFSNISKKMFGYKSFRKFSYFPVRWMQIHNSLHDKSPSERLPEKLRNRIANTYESGVTTGEAESKEDVSEFYKMLKNFYRFKFQRFIPKKSFFESFNEDGRHKIFITRYKKWVIGGCAVVYTKGNAYLWYLASKRKSFPMQHPNLMTVWHAMDYSYNHGYHHIYFMNVGLPFRKNPQREFILRFQGKPASTYRWFRCSFKWLNKVLNWIYRE